MHMLRRRHAGGEYRFHVLRRVLLARNDVQWTDFGDASPARWACLFILNRQQPHLPIDSSTVPRGPLSAFAAAVVGYTSSAQNTGDFGSGPIESSARIQHPISPVRWDAGLHLPPGPATPCAESCWRDRTNSRTANAKRGHAGEGRVSDRRRPSRCRRRRSTVSGERCCGKPSTDEPATLSPKTWRRATR